MVCEKPLESNFTDTTTKKIDSLSLLFLYCIRIITLSKCSLLTALTRVNQMDKPTVKLEISIEQAQTLSMACEMVARLYMAQTDVLSHICNATWDDLRKVKDICFPELPHNAYKGINEKSLPDQARQLWDIYQVLRHFLSWRDEPNTPKTRDWVKQLGVNFDEPMRTSENCYLPIITEEKNK